jgi:hypothetical protein
MLNSIVQIVQCHRHRQENLAMLKQFICFIIGTGMEQSMQN